MNLTLIQQPAAFAQIANSALNTGATLTAAILQALNENTKFAAVRNEEFYGQYTNGQTVVLPVSPIDGYAYARNELSYLCTPYWTGKLLPDLYGGSFGLPYDLGIDSDGGPIPSSKGYASGPGNLARLQFTVNQSTGVVLTTVTYSGGGGATTDGIVMVMTLARRLR